MSDAEPDAFLPTRSSLLSRLRKWDDKRSWDEFVRTYERLIHSVALKAGLREQEARDVVQETLVSVAKEMPDFQYDPKKGSFKGWLKLVTRRRIADFWRKNSRQVRLAEPFENDDGTSRDPLEHYADPAAENLDDIWDSEWKKHLFTSALERVKGQVSARAYQIFDLCVLQEKSTTEAAEAVGVSAGNIYITKHRVALLLKKEVRALEKEYEAEAEAARRAGHAGAKN